MCRVRGPTGQKRPALAGEPNTREQAGQMPRRARGQRHICDKVPLLFLNLPTGYEHYSLESSVARLDPRKSPIFVSHLALSSQKQRTEQSHQPAVKSGRALVDDDGKAASWLARGRAHPLEDATRPEQELGAPTTVRASVQTAREGWQHGGDLGA